MAINYNRRKFLRNSAAWAMAVRAFPGLARGHNLLKAAGGPEGLERAFLEPPDSAWPWVYWFVSDGNLTREGITADFEAMRRVGIRGALYMEVDQYVPKGSARFLSPQWREMIQHAEKEATRLGITINMNNDGGWTGSGGPWITPEQSMQIMVWSETSLQGPKQFTGTLPQPKIVENYYRDISVLAFPTPSTEGQRMAESSPQFTYGVDRQSFDSAPLTDGNPGTSTIVPAASAGQRQYLNIDFPEPFTAQCLTVALDTTVFDKRLVFPTVESTIEISDDGRNFRMIREFTLRWPACSVNFEKVTARHYRISLLPILPYGTPLGEVELHHDFRIEDIAGKAAYAREENFHGPDLISGEPSVPPEMAVRRDQIVDISAKMDQNGQLTWDVPEGKWTVLRIGHTSTGKMNHPAPQESLGLECDKLSKKATEAMFDGLMAKLLEDQGAVGAKALTMTHIDSWEVGSQNWTPGFREEFQKRYGYDLLPFLPTLTGRVVESREVSERFLWDLRRIVADLVLENYAGHMQKISHQHGLTLSIEAYGVGPLDEVALGGRADVPMSEFWRGEGAGHPLTWNKEMASSGHVYGHPIIAAESFTAIPDDGRWQSHPYRMKPLGDLAFSQGINRFVFHRYSAQPWVDRKPGMTMGPHGIHYERTNTWWEQSRAWHAYLARCQSLLQSGRFVADVACLGTENAPNTFPDGKSMIPSLPPGYDFDDLPPEVLLKRVTVQDGRLVLPSGMSYRVLVLPSGRTMTPALLGKIKELVVAGATVVGPPPASSPSLAHYPRCDDEVQQLAAELWGECDGVSITANRCGNGYVMWGRPLAEVLRELHTPPDFACHMVAVPEEIRYIHRNVDGDEVYFVASGVPDARRILCTFRVKAKRPELWWPDTGRTEPVTVYNEQEGNMLIPLSLDPYGSVFVVFRAGTALLPDRVVSIRRDGEEISGLAPKPAPEIQLQQESGAVHLGLGGEREYRLEVGEPGMYELKTAASRTLKVEVPALPNALEIGGPWELEFPRGLGAPAHVTLERLISWTGHSNPGVRYFSGTATYRRKFEVPAGMLGKGRALYLDLGRVMVIAQAKLNGRDLGIWWKPPFRGNVTDILHAGANELAVSVVNLWPNRLIGDEQLPDDCEWALPPANRRGMYLRRYPQWLLDNKPSPTGRVAFTTWKHWTKDDPLMESGLLGPVRIVARARMSLG
jgi:hypothetical protein